ncbi:unnamed protein product [Closterium sp. NIES-54]
MVDGTKLPIHGETTLQLQIGALRWKPTLPVMNIKGLDIILGGDILKFFNPKIDWVNWKASIYNNGKRVKLRRWTDTGNISKVTLAQFEQTWNESNTGYLALVMAVAEGEKPNSELPAAVRTVLEEYKDIMPDDLPAGMPPAQNHEHEIMEEPGAKPVSRAPYRLSSTELADMKKHIIYMLDPKQIRPSTSPYGAPVLFTPNPHGSLRMRRRCCHCNCATTAAAAAALAAIATAAAASAAATTSAASAAAPATVATTTFAAAVSAASADAVAAPATTTAATAAATAATTPATAASAAAAVTTAAVALAPLLLTVAAYHGDAYSTHL